MQLRKSAADSIGQKKQAAVNAAINFIVNSGEWIFAGPVPRGDMRQRVLPIVITRQKVVLGVAMRLGEEFAHTIGRQLPRFTAFDLDQTTPALSLQPCWCVDIVIGYAS